MLDKAGNWDETESPYYRSGLWTTIIFLEYTPFLSKADKPNTKEENEYT